MKKFLVSHLAILTAAMFCFSSSHSQFSASGKIASVERPRQHGAAINDAISESADHSTLMNLRSANARVYDHFNASFKNATNIKVSTLQNQTYISCYVDSILNKVRYTKKGKWLNTVRYFGAARLPENIRDEVADAYPRYSIFGFVAEVNVPGKTAWLVMIEDKTTWKRVRILDNVIDTYEEYNKPL